MAQPSPYELKLIQKITRAVEKLERNKKQHKATCLSGDPHMPGKCSCGADEVNTVISAVIQELDLSN